MNELSPREWISAKEAARILKVSERQINYYGAKGQISIKRAGRRVLYSLEDVNQLAQTLDVDIRPQPITRSDVNEQLARYVQERQQRDQEFLEEQRTANERLARIEQRLSTPAPQPRGPSWQVIAVLGIVLAIALVVLVIVLRIL